MRFWLSLLALWIGVTAASAQGADQIDCARTEVQIELNYCAEQAWLRADAELNAVWPRAMAVARDLGSTNDIKASDLLRDAQRAWIAFRDAACAAEAQLAAGGSMMGMIASGCLERLTRARIDDLTLFAEGT